MQRQAYESFEELVHQYANDWFKYSVDTTNVLAVMKNLNVDKEAVIAFLEEHIARFLVDQKPLLPPNISEERVWEAVDTAVDRAAGVFVKKAMRRAAGLVDEARRNLELAGLFDKDADYGSMLGDAVMRLVKTHAAEGHSGFSHQMAMRIFNEVANRKCLTAQFWDEQEQACYNLAKNNMPEIGDPRTSDQFDYAGFVHDCIGDRPADIVNANKIHNVKKAPKSNTSKHLSKSFHYAAYKLRG